jgi:hypothetical protein
MLRRVAGKPRADAARRGGPPGVALACGEVSLADAVARADRASDRRRGRRTDRAGLGRRGGAGGGLVRVSPGARAAPLQGARPNPTSRRAFGRGGRSRHDEHKARTCRTNRRAADQPGTPSTRSRRLVDVLVTACKRLVKRGGPRGDQVAKATNGREGSRSVRMARHHATQGRYLSFPSSTAERARSR